MRNGELRAPLGALSGRGLETLLRRYTLPVRDVRDFDVLPIPFRALATDMETGQPVVLLAGRPGAGAALEHERARRVRADRADGASSATAAWSTTCRWTWPARWAPTC